MYDWRDDSNQPRKHLQRRKFQQARRVEPMDAVDALSAAATRLAKPDPEQAPRMHKSVLRLKREE